VGKPGKTTKRTLRRKKPKVQIIRFDFELDQAFVLIPGSRVVHSDLCRKTARWVLWVEMPAGEAIEPLKDQAALLS
jgi:hypothetical protein